LDIRNTTNTDRIKGLIWQILQHPDGFTGEILVGDNTQWAPINHEDKNSEDTEQCILDVINTFYSKGYPVYLFEWKNIMFDVVTEYSDGDYNDGYIYDSTSKVTYAKFLSPSGNYYISLKYGIRDSTFETYDHNRLCIIDFPVLKTQGWTGVSTEPQTYNYRDTTVTSRKYYYRLKQVDYDGSYSYSHIVEVDLG